MNCPVCKSGSVGRVGTEQYYCWECCVEFSVGKKGLEVFVLDSEGGLTLLEDGVRCTLQAQPS